MEDMEGYTIKLKILNKDDEVRRIPSHKLFKNDKKPYKRLVALAVAFFQGDDFDINASPEDFSVKISYIDNEGDKITISSQDEFTEATKELIACNQSKRLDRPRNQRSQYILRFEACVLKKKDDSLKEAPDEVKESLREMKERLVKCEKASEMHRICKSKPCYPLQASAKRLMRLEGYKSEFKTLLNPNRLKKRMEEDKEAAALIISILEAFIVYLKNTVSTLKAHTPNNTEMKDTSMCTEETKPSKSAMENVKPPVALNEIEPDTPKKVMKTEKKCGKLARQKREKMMSANLNKACSTMRRHRGIKCDGCGMVPIVGTRYHAKPDFDLCTKCYGINKSDMKFEVIETPKCKFMRKPQSAVTPIPTTYPTKKKSFTNNLDSTFVHARHTCDGCMTTPIVGLRYNAINLKDYDLCSTCFTKCKDDDIAFECVELAADRLQQNLWKQKFSFITSLQVAQAQVKKEEPSKVPQNTQTEKNVSSGTTCDGQGLNDAEKMQIAAALAKSFVTQAVESVKGSPANDRKEKATEEHSDATASTVDSSNDLEEEMKNSEEKSTLLLKNEIKNDIEDVTKLMVEITTMEDKSETKANVDEVSHADATTITDGSVPTQTENESKMNENRKETNDTSKSDNFSEVSSNSSIVNVSLEDEIVDDELKGEENVEAGENEDVACLDDKMNISEEELKSTADEEESSGTTDEWDMVDEEKDQIENDAMLARAAQMVGSLLFEEDQGRSKEVKSITSTNSDISAMLLNKWGNELYQLRELGFIDDKKSIEVVESLQAANIGVDSDEPIQIEKIVDELLKRTEL